MSLAAVLLHARSVMPPGGVLQHERGASALEYCVVAAAVVVVVVTLVVVFSVRAEASILAV